MERSVIIDDRKIDGEMKEYNKYKERSPQETVLEIQRILNGIGVVPLICWTGDAASGTHSCHVTLYPSEKGTNGKGTDDRYCLASGLAEMMERLQNNLLLSSPKFAEDAPDCGFSVAPDEEKMPLKELLSRPDPFTARILSQLQDEDALSNGEALCDLLSNSCGEMTALPFTDLKTGERYRLPAYVLRYINGSNGMAAGNTPEEALVQGLSELMEREVNRLVLEGLAIPPEIPDEALEPYSFYPLIQDLRSRKQYRVSVLDCSLGRDWPVAALCVRNVGSGTFGIHFGAHPSFPVAVERTLTEAAQGCSLDAFSCSCRTAEPEKVMRTQNLLNVAATGAGLYPLRLFTAKPGWAFRPWSRFQGPGNREFLREMTELLYVEGCQILVRDVSFLGFPSCHIVIPNFRTMRQVNGAAVRLMRSQIRAAASWDHFPALSVEEADRILRLICYYEGSVSNSAIGLVSCLPLNTSAFSDDRLGAYLALQLRRYSRAEHFFGKLARTESDQEQRRFYTCMGDYCAKRAFGLPHEDAAAYIRQFHSKEAAEETLLELKEIWTQNTLPASLFPKLNCPDCEHCSLSGKGCRYRAEAEAYRKVVMAMKR